MASPLILRPIKFTDGRFGAIILRLTTPLLTSVYLAATERDKKFDIDLARSVLVKESEIRNKKLLSYDASPMGKAFDGEPPENASGSALDSFLAYAEKQGFRKVLP